MPGGHRQRNDVIVMERVEEHFAARGRTPKGRRALLAIFRATREITGTRGLDAASLEAIAARAELSQAALRHYFGTRDELLDAFFVAATRWLRAQVAALLKDGGLPAGQQLEQCIAWHLEFMENVDTVFWLESSAYWLRHPPPRQSRDEWYRWLVAQYARLIGGIQPRLGPRECQRRAYALLTLVLGAWITHGKGSAVTGAGGPAEQRRLLVATAMALVSR
ncbi:MAG: TetR/AcrR family transcriptional regulator [Chromatiales bacterium]|nr:TetR/AcrR family transcriptional regulator [Chromatiales bacterium]